LEKQPEKPMTIAAPASTKKVSLAFFHEDLTCVSDLAETTVAWRVEKGTADVGVLILAFSA